MTTIYFHTPDVNHAAGGLRAVYRIVDACNAVGMSAAVMHQRRGFRATWFESDTRTVAATDTPVHGNDVLVVSELDAPRLLDAAPGVTKVILNQHQYWTFAGGPVDYTHQDVAAVIAVSKDGVRYLECAFPGLKPYRLRYAVDSSIFRPGSLPRQRILAYLGNKGTAPRRQVLSMLHQRQSFLGWTHWSLAGLSQVQMASALAECAILATFSESEGFQMLLTEAMASGTAVVGFDAGGGREYLTEDLSWPVPAGDIVRFVERLEEVATLWDADPKLLEIKTGSAIDLVRERYTLENEAADAVAALTAAYQRATGLPKGQSFDVSATPSRSAAYKARARAVGRALLHG